MHKFGKGFGKKKTKSKKITDREYEYSLLRLTHKCTKIKVNEKEVYPLLQSNIYILDDYFVKFISQWADRVFPRIDLERAKILAASIAVLSKAIQDIPFGNKANNLEIAIEGYRTVTKVFTANNFPEEWACVQNDLGIAFTFRIRGDKAENIETALMGINSK